MVRVFLRARRIYMLAYRKKSVPQKKMQNAFFVERNLI